MQKTRIRLLVENTARSAGILGEHGLSYWIEQDGNSVLFDTGQGIALESNAMLLDIDLSEASAIVLSHGHYDHTGGLQTALSKAPEAAVYLHPAAFLPRFSIRHGQPREIGMESAHAARLLSEDRNLVLTEEPTEICPGVYVTGQVPRGTDYEDTGGLFFLDAEAKLPDPIADDQALYINTQHGTVIILGCAHAGVINTIRYILELTNGEPIHAVLGGMHLLNASEERMQSTIEALREINPQWIGPAHCTGPFAAAKLFSEFPDRRLAVHSGADIRIPIS